MRPESVFCVWRIHLVPYLPGGRVTAHAVRLCGFSDDCVIVHVCSYSDSVGVVSHLSLRDSLKTTLRLWAVTLVFHE